MKKAVLTLCFALFCFGIAHAQVGINTTTPNAQLDIKSSNQAAPSNTDGLLIPKVDAFPVINPTAAQKGMLVYLNVVSGANQPGFYYWNNPGWVGISSDSSAWKLTGNAGTNQLTHFIGTTDNQDLIFKRDGNKMGYIGTTNIAFGNFALSSFGGSDNIAFGSNALSAAIGSDNIGIGRSALSFNTGAFNVALGSGSLFFNTGSNNIALGTSSLVNNTSGSNNLGIGRSALATNTSGTNNIGIGSGAGSNITLGSNNITIGTNANAVFALGSNQLNIGDLLFGNTGATKNLGINAISPKGMLDVESTTNGILIPRIGLTATNVSAPVVNPQGGALATSTLIYNTNTTGISPNNVVPGFYYWDNTSAKWIPIISGTGGGTLDQAYDFGGAGAGRTITADTGAVTIAGTDGFVSTGTSGSGAIAPSGAGTRLVWNPNKGAFRSGGAAGTEWDNANIGSFSTAFGFATRASGANSAAFGGGTVANGVSSAAFGGSTTASGDYSASFGISTTASGARSATFGFGNFASGINSFAIGTNNTASGQISTVSGSNNTANGLISTVSGLNNTAPSIGETAVGIGATTYTPSVNGDSQFRAANATDRLLVVGNAIDSNNNGTVDLAERSDALVILKNGNIGIGSSTPQDKLHVVGNIRMVDGNQAVGKVFTSNANGTASWQNASANAWGLTGNLGTNAGTNFIGTLDAQDLVFKRNNILSGRLGTSNSSFGLNTLTSITSGTENTAHGVGALTANTTGSGNTAIGFNTLTSNTTGIGNTATGVYALAANTTGLANTATGAQTLEANTTGFANTATGSAALLSNTTGTNNTATGSATLPDNTLGSDNTANGSDSLWVNTTGNGNTAIGSAALNQNLSGNNNTATGMFALSSNNTGSENTGLGYRSSSLFNLTNATAVGARAQVGASNSMVLGSITGVNGATSNVNVGIGTTTPADHLHVVGNIRMVDGNQAAGKVMVSDANGTATWTAAGTLASGTLDQAYDFGGAGAGRTITADTGAVTIDGTDGLVSTGTAGSGALAPSGAGTRMVWNPRKEAFRAGSVSSTRWDDSNIGTRSTAFGDNNLASGQNSVAMGFSTRASSGNSFAMGSVATASGLVSTAFGNLTTASGFVSFAMGHSNTAPSACETVLGVGATTYTPILTTGWGPASGTDRLLVVGNSTDANGNQVVEASERSDALVILKNGNTGIGSSTPQTKLEIVDVNKVTATASEGNLNVVTNTPQNTDIGGSISLGGFGSSTTATSVFGTIEGRKANNGALSDSGYLAFKTNNLSVLTERMRITQTGNVGIGAVAPLDKLHVVGNIRMVDGNQAAGNVMVSDANGTGTWTAAGTLASGTLDEAYDFGGAGAGRTITADAGAVTIAGVDGLVATGTIGSGVIAPSGAGARMVWNPRKGAFRVGNAIGTSWDDVNIGVQSVALGGSSTASGLNSTAIGLGNIASGDYSTAIGRGSLASGDSSIALGVGTTASGVTTTAMGNLSVASGNFSTAIGFISRAIGVAASSIGMFTVASGDVSTVMGASNTASSYGETVLGLGATTYTPTVNGTTQFRAANVADRLLVVGNAIDANNNNNVDVAERSDALVILKNGNTGIGTSTPQTTLELVAGNKITATFDEGILNVVSNNPQNTNIGGSISLGGFGSSTTATSVFATVEGRKSDAVATSNAGYLVFKTSGAGVGAVSERLRITSVGDVGIGTAAPGGQFELSLNEGRKPGTNTWTIVSDQRLKTLNGNYTKGLNEILQLKPVRYNYKNNGSRTFEKEVLDTEFAGFLAQEVQPLFPEAVGTDDDGFLNFNIHPILIASVNAFKELDTKNKELQAENQSLKAELEKLKDKVDLILNEMQKR